MRACHQAAWACRAGSGQSDAASRGICHSSQDCVKGRAQRFQRGLRLLPQHVDLGVVGDRFQGDVGGAFVDKTLAQVVVHRRIGSGSASEATFLCTALAAVGQKIERVFRRH
jgi:hypothetical protein